MTGPADLEKWTSDLVPGLYNLRLQADRSYEQVLDLRPGEQLAVQLISTDEGGGRASISTSSSSAPLRPSPAMYRQAECSCAAFPGRQPLFVFLKNGSLAARDLIVEVLAESQVIASSGPTAVPKGVFTVAAPRPGQPSPKPTDPLPEAPRD